MRAGKFVSESIPYVVETTKRCSIRVIPNGEFDKRAEPNSRSAFFRASIQAKSEGFRQDTLHQEVSFQ